MPRLRPRSQPSGSKDLMIGGPSVAVDGLDSAGNAAPILRENVWVLE